jgi:hypothetical protein
LRAFTPDDAKAMKATANTFPISPYDLEHVLTSMGTGEAAVTVLSDKGAPTPVAWTRMCAPRGLMDVAPEETIDAVVKASPRSATYGQVVDRESAYELLTAKIATHDKAVAEQEAAEAKAKEEYTAAKTSSSSSRRKRQEKSVVEKVISSQPVKSFARQAGREIGNQILRSLFGTRKR